MNICIIPARGGSKRIPRKNIKPFNGRPMIAYSIEVALKSELFSEVIVSTEDEEIAEISRSYGASVPFMRSEKNADDHTGTGDVCFEVLSKYSQMGREFQNVCCMYATTPLTTVPRLLEAFNLLNNSNYDVVFPVAKYSSPIWRSYRLDPKSGVSVNFPEFIKSRSQDLPESYYDAGQFYWFNAQEIVNMDNKNVFGNNKGVIILDDIEVQDIDNIDDWHIAEIKHHYLMQKKE